MSITRVISAEFERVLSNCEATYSTLDKFVMGKREETKVLRRTISQARTKISEARAEYEKLAQSGTHEFTLENMLMLQRLFDKLEMALPDQETTKGLVNSISLEFGRTNVAHMYSRIKSNLPYSSTLNIASLLSAAYLDNSIAAAIYGSAAVSGILETHSKNESLLRSIWANAGTLVGATALLYFSDADMNSLDKNLMFITGASHLLTYFQANALFRYGFTKSQFDSGVHRIQNLRIDFDNLMRSGAAIPEAIGNLEHAKKIIRAGNMREGRLHNQLENLEQTLIDYFTGEVYFDDVVKARVRYLPKQIASNEEKKRVSPAQKTTRGERKRANRTEHRTPREYSTSYRTTTGQLQYEPPSFVNVGISGKLSLIYLTNYSVGGYSMNPLLDLTMTKIGRNPSGEKIREESGQHLLRRIRSRHGLSSDVAVFKMQPIGSLRALYIRQGTNITVLDVMTHPEYDRLMKP